MSLPRSKILVVQWARMGDLFHSRPLCQAALRKFHPADITLSCDARYVEIVRSFPEVTSILPLPLQRMTSLARIDFTLPDLLSDISEEMCDLKYDAVINLTNHKSAVIFSSLFYTGEVYGYGHRGDAALKALEGSFNDAGRRTHVAAAWKSLISDSKETEALLTVVPPSPRVEKGSTAVICDAGDPDRSLAAHTISNIIDVLSEGSCANILLLGARRDDGTTSMPAYVHDLRGQTSLLDLRDRLARAEFVIGPDTGALHYAAALGKRLLGIYLAGARPDVTGPLTHNAQCVSANIQDDIFIYELRETIRSAFGTKDTDRSVEQRRSDPNSLTIIITENGQTHYADVLIGMLRSCNLPKGTQFVIMSSNLQGAELAFASERTNITADIAGHKRTFADACNKGALLATGEWLLFLNDDCEISEEQFSTLWAARSEELICAPRLQYWDNELQSAGFVFDGQDVNEITSSSNACAIDGVSAAAMLLNRNTFLSLGGFYNGFRNGYEDVDLCLRAHDEGVTCKVVDCDILHFRGSSPERYQQEDENLSLLRSRWSKTVPARKVRRAMTHHSAGVLIVSDDAKDSAGAVLRWRHPLRELGLIEGKDTCWICANETEPAELDKALARATAVVVFRSIADSRLRHLLLEWQLTTGGELILDCDDLVLNRFRAGSPRAISRGAYESGIQEIADKATIISCANQLALEQFQFSGARKLILETVPMQEHFEYGLPANRANTLNIGYAGSPVHQTDFALVADSIAGLLEAHDELRFFWWGAHPGALAYHPKVRRGGQWVGDYLQHLRRIRNAPIDLWISPLADSPHNSVRSPIKAFEYIGAGKPCLFSKVMPFNGLLSTLAPDLLVDNTMGDWTRAIDTWLSQPSRLTRQLEDARDHLRMRVGRSSAYATLFEYLGMESRSAAIQHMSMGVRV